MDKNLHISYFIRNFAAELRNNMFKQLNIIELWQELT